MRNYLLFSGILFYYDELLSIHHPILKRRKMRTYPHNSPEAAARILALVLIADGHACHSEFEALNQADGVRHLGLVPQKMSTVVQALCEDLRMEGFDGRTVHSHLGDALVSALLAEVDEPRLQAQVLRLAGKVVRADQHVSDGEVEMLEALSRAWQADLLSPTLTKAH
jgi:uncharacterized tellurite resistance protein B-like protein